MKILRAALFGAGSMGANHARVISQSQHSTIDLIVEPNKVVGRNLAQKYNSKWVPQLENFLRIDYVIIATPTEKHFDIAMQAISAKVPILIEKPISNSLESTLEILNAARKAQVPIICGLVERFNPAIITLKTIVQEILNVQIIRHSPRTLRIQNSVTSDLLIHDLDTVINLYKEIPLEAMSKTFSIGRNSPEIPDAHDVLLSFSAGRFANVSASRISQRKIRNLSLIENDRLIEVDLLRRDLTIYKNVSEDFLMDGVGYKQQTIIELPSLITSEEPLVGQLNYFTELLVNQNSDGIEAEYRSLEILHKVVMGLEF